MSYFKFDENDIFTNTIEAYPEYKYYIHSGTVYIDNFQHISGTYSENITGVPAGHISLHEYNINRSESQRIYPFLTKGGLRSTFRGISNNDFNTQYGYGGEDIQGSYNMSASITRIPISTPSRPKIDALRTSLRSYHLLSRHYEFSSSFGNKETQDVNLINIPHILYGSQIKRGSVSLKYFISGSLVGELQDKNLNGELIQVGPQGSTGSGSVAGVVLYNEGIMMLTGAWTLESNSITYDGATANGKWYYFGMGANDNATIDSSNLSASFSIDYKGVNRIQTLNMFCHASYSDLNNSNNPTYTTGSFSQTTGPYKYHRNPREVHNIVSSSFTDINPTLQKTTYISKIAIYDRDRNLIGIAQLATPVRKTIENQYTFKLKLDI